MSYTIYVSQLFINEPESLEILLELADKKEIQYGYLCAHDRTKERIVTKSQELGLLYINKKGIVCISQFGTDIISKLRANTGK